MLNRSLRRQLVPLGSSGRAAVRVTRLRQVRNYAVQTGPAQTEQATAPSLPKKRRFVRRVLLYTSVFASVFYGASTLVAFNSDRYHDFFVESVPLGETIVDYAESQGWNRTLSAGAPKEIVEGGKTVYNKIDGAITRTFGSSSSEPAPPPTSGQQSPGSFAQKKEKLRGVASTIITKVQKNADQSPHTPLEVVQVVKKDVIQFSHGVADLVKEVETALAGRPFVPTPAEAVAAVDAAATPSESAPAPVTTSDQKVYTTPLPLGFQPPPGYVLPSKPKPAPSPDVKAEPAPPALPLIAPTVTKLSTASSEPVISHLAETIDKLASFVQNNPTAITGGAKDVLQAAELDLTQLGERIDVLKEEEKRKLEDKLDEQAKEYSLKMLELEADAQDKIDRQEEDWKSLFEEERSKLSSAYRQKLEAELATQSEIINQRLKEEVVAQGIELQRRWIRDIKVRVEQERGGRLAKLEDLATNVKRLERVTLDNSSYIDENVNVHALWSAIRAFGAAIEAPTRRPFREELRVLQNVVASRADPVLTATLDTIAKSNTPDVGVEPLPDLATWLTTTVVPKVESVALVPDTGAGLLSHLASSVLSKFRFKRRGLVEGSDVSSVLARAEHYVNEKDLDSAARELNQLTGWPKILLSDWLAAARQRLEVQQALEVAQTQATLASLLVL